MVQISVFCAKFSDFFQHIQNSLTGKFCPIFPVDVGTPVIITIIILTAFNSHVSDIFYAPILQGNVTNTHFFLFLFYSH